jgi:hypothetical protein
VSTRMKALLASLFMVFGMFAFQVERAAAYQAGGKLPTIKEPPSARFDISGNFSIAGGSEVGNVSVQLTGGGAMAGSNFQEDITVNVPGGSPAGGPASVTSSIIVVDNMYYFKTSGSTPGTEDKWYVMDLSKVSGGNSVLPGMGGSSLTGLDPKYEAALQTQQLGKETINGASTTKYQINVDIQKLLELMGSSSVDPETAKTLANAKFVVYMWIGDDDSYVHQTRAVLDMKVSVPNSSDVTLALDFLITFKDFGAPITITAPANAQPLDVGTTGSSDVGSLLLGMPTSVIVSGMPSQMPTGMPTTGVSNADWPIAPLALGLVFLAVGALLRRRASLVR